MRSSGAPAVTKVAADDDTNVAAEPVSVGACSSGAPAVTEVAADDTSVAAEPASAVADVAPGVVAVHVVVATEEDDNAGKKTNKGRKSTPWKAGPAEVPKTRFREFYEQTVLTCMLVVQDVLRDA